MYPAVPQRPSGVTILAVLYFISGVFWFIGAAIWAAFSFVLFTPISDPTGGSLVTATLAAICAGLFGILALVVGWGLWTLQPWAWTVALIFAIIGLLNFPLGTIVSIIILIYLFRPEIKAVFRKGPPVAYPPQPGYPTYPPPPGSAPYPPPATTPYSPPGTAPYAPPPPPPPSATTQVQPPQGAFPATCRNCGAPLDPGVSFCRNCGTKVQ